MVLLMPALFSVMFLGLQGALFYHARTVAIAAAQEGARTAAGLNGTGSAGAADAYAFVTDAGGDDVLKARSAAAPRRWRPGPAGRLLRRSQRAAGRRR